MPVCCTFSRFHNFSEDIQLDCHYRRLKEGRSSCHDTKNKTGKMGNLCECMKLQPETSRESTPLISRDDIELRTAPSDAERGAKYYQSVIDEAHRNFISSSSRRRMAMGSEAEELRSVTTPCPSPSLTLFHTNSSFSFTHDV